jgi:hypothetical protein
VVPLVIGLVVVIRGAVPAALITRVKEVGPADPAPFVAVIPSVFDAALDGVPDSSPPTESVSPAGMLVPVQVMGVLPDAVN